MISDTLHDAVSEIDELLVEDGWRYDEITRKHIIAVRDHMDCVRCMIDAMCLPYGTLLSRDWDVRSTAATP
jgi:hypothetical protein